MSMLTWTGDPKPASPKFLKIHNVSILALDDNAKDVRGQVEFDLGNGGNSVLW
jgi:hypothetical protein